MGGLLPVQCCRHKATLHLLGLEHTKLTYRYSERDMPLTDVPATRFARF